MTKKYFHDIFDQSIEVNCPIEGWHTESGPGVFEAVRSPKGVPELGRS